MNMYNKPRMDMNMGMNNNYRENTKYIQLNILELETVAKIMV